MSHTHALYTLLQSARSDLLGALAPFSLATWPTRHVHTTHARWTLLHLGRHLLDMHLFQRRQIEAILAGHPTVDAAFDLNHWNHLGQERMQLFSPQDLLAGLDASQQHLLQLLDTLTPAQLTLEGWHFAIRQPLTLQRFIELIAIHEQYHTAEIADC